MLINKNDWIKNPYHLVELRPWPILGSTGALFLVIGTVMWFHYNRIILIFIGVIIIIITIIQWWRDVVRESTIQGIHTKIVIKGLKWGMILFIISECILFFSFFWAFFHSRLAPSIEIGEIWPPVSINPLSPLGVPLLNTLVLLSSGVTVTWAHHSLLSGNHIEIKTRLFFTVVLGLYFTYLQAGEYLEVRFSIRDSVYGTTFYVITGFHGAHVIIGTTILVVRLIRQYFIHFRNHHHFGFEAAAWYWHFVDVVWLLLFVRVYVWGS